MKIFNANNKLSQYLLLLALATALLPGTMVPVFAQPNQLQLTLRGSWPGYARGPALDVTVVSNRAYVAIGKEGLAIFDVSNPAQPMRLAGIATSGLARKVQVAGNYAYVGHQSQWTGSNNLARWDVLNVSNPASPTPMGSYETAGTANGAHVLGNNAYLADGSAGLEVLDVR